MAKGWDKYMPRLRTQALISFSQATQLIRPDNTCTVIMLTLLPVVTPFVKVKTSANYWGHYGLGTMVTLAYEAISYELMKQYLHVYLGESVMCDMIGAGW